MPAQNKPLFLASFGLLAALALAHQAHAEVDSLVREAVALTDKDQARAAFDLLEPKESDRAGS